MDNLVLQVIAVALGFASSWNYGNRSTLGPVLGIAANLAFMVMNWQAGLWLVAALCAVMCAISVRNTVKWSRC